MAAYAIFRLLAEHDADKLDEYRIQARPTLVEHSARPLILRGKQQTFEGENSTATVVFEFSDYEAAMAWYSSPEYQACKALRADAADMEVTIVEGIPA